jgi:hypothetical protein
MHFSTGNPTCSRSMHSVRWPPAVHIANIVASARKIQAHPRNQRAVWTASKKRRSRSPTGESGEDALDGDRR